MALGSKTGRKEDTSPPSKSSQSHQRQILKQVIHKQLHDYNCDESYEGKVQSVPSVFTRRLVCSLWEQRPKERWIWWSMQDLCNFQPLCVILSHLHSWRNRGSQYFEICSHRAGAQNPSIPGIFLPSFHHIWGCPWWPRKALQMILPISTIYFRCSFVMPSN